MTPKQKKLKLESIIALITAAGFTQDSYGNYKRSLADHSYRIKLKKINIRIERKSILGGEWYKITSQPISKIEIENLVKFMSKFFKA